MNWHGLLTSHHDNTTIEVRCLWSMVGLIQQWSTQTWVMYFAIYLTQYMTGKMMSQEIGIGYLYIIMFDEQISFKTLVCLWGCFRQSSRGKGVSEMSLEQWFLVNLEYFLPDGSMDGKFTYMNSCCFFQWWMKVPTVHKPWCFTNLIRWVIFNQQGSLNEIHFLGRMKLDFTHLLLTILRGFP